MAADITPELLAQLESLVDAGENFPLPLQSVTVRSLVAAAKERDQLRVEVERLKEEVQASDMNMAAIMDGTFAVGDGPAQREIERLRELGAKLRAFILSEDDIGRQSMWVLERIADEIERKP